MTANPHTRRPRRAGRFLSYAGIVALLALITAGLWPRPVNVETVQVTTGPLRSTINEEGRTRVRQRFVVSAPVTGLLRRTPLKAGAEVRTGETVVAAIDPLPPGLLDERARSLAEARRDTAVAQLGKSRASRDHAAGELRRYTRLRAEGSVSAQEFEATELRDAAATRDLAASESALRQAEAELAEFTGASDATRTPIEIRAPATGRILRVLEENARVVLAGTALLEIGDPADLEIVIEMLSRDAAGLPPGTRVELDHWGGEGALEARVRLVEPAAFTKVSALGVEEQRVNVVADLVTPSAQRPGLGDRFRVEAHVIAWEDPQALQAASGALFRRDDGWAAFVVKDGRTWLRPVNIGRQGQGDTQILSGLNQGDTLVHYPGDRIRDGLRVRPVRIAP